MKGFWLTLDQRQHHVKAAAQTQNCRFFSKCVSHQVSLAYFESPFWYFILQIHLLARCIIARSENSRVGCGEREMRDGDREREEESRKRPSPLIWQTFTTESLCAGSSVPAIVVFSPPLSKVGQALFTLCIRLRVKTSWVDEPWHCCRTGSIPQQPTTAWSAAGSGGGERNALSAKVGHV